MPGGYDTAPVIFLVRNQGLAPVFGLWVRFRFDETLDEQLTNRSTVLSIALALQITRACDTRSLPSVLSILRVSKNSISIFQGATRTGV